MSRVTLGQFKSPRQIGREWDRVAGPRDADLWAGRDVSYANVLEPAILNAIPDWSGLRVLDVGCGTGMLARHLARRGATIEGIDVSEVSIRLATDRAVPGTAFHRSTVESYVNDSPFDVVVANMTFQTVADWEPFFAAIVGQLKPDGRIVATIPHPCFWPIYWHYDRETWFDYRSERAVEADLVTTLNRDGYGRTTHYHRPLEFYFQSFLRAFLQIVDFREWPTIEQSGWQPTQTTPFPRFVSFVLRRNVTVNGTRLD
jgi:2-polyprenyl-3-methyl-5-hydroxy-6-metoxy-1,4-benzoquinol methylase